MLLRLSILVASLLCSLAATAQGSPAVPQSPTRPLPNAPAPLPAPATAPPANTSSPASVGMPPVTSGTAPQSPTGFPNDLTLSQSGASSSMDRGPLVPITLDEALAQARTGSPLLQGAAATVARSQAAVRTSTQYLNPSFEIFEGKQSARPIATPGVPGLLQHYAGYQPIEIPLERRARRRVAELGVASSRFAQAGQQLTVTANVEHAFFEALRRKEEIEHARENLQLVEDLRRRVEVEVRVGEKGRLELTRAEAELARARFGVRSAQLLLADAIAVLRVAIAAPPETHLDPQGSLDDTPALPPLAEARANVLRNHPALGQARSDVDVARASLDRERALRLPQPTLFGEYERQPDLSFWRTGLTIQIPLWDRRKGQIADAQAAIQQSSSVVAQRRLELLSSLERGYEQYQLADQQVTSLQSGSLHEAESAVEAAKAAYRFGERGIVEVLDAQRVLQSVRGDLLDAQFERQSALIDLQELGAIARPQSQSSGNQSQEPSPK